MLNDPDARVRESATNALLKIAPEALEKARVQESSKLRQEN